MKPTKWGLKAFVLADSITGYIVNIIPYTGQETKEIYLSQCNPDLPLYAQVVVALVDKYLGKQHHLYADRFYSSVPLVDELERQGTRYIGTLVKTRQQLPKVVRQSGFKLQKGESKAWRDRKKMVIAWKDKGKPTILISSVHSATITNVTDRHGSVK